LLRRLSAQPQVIENHGRHFGGVSRREEKLAHVTVQKIKDAVENSIEDEQPGKKEMPPSAAGQPEVTGDRDPAGKSARERAGIGVLKTKHARGIDAIAEQLGITANLAVFVRCRNRKKSFFRFSFISPMERGKALKICRPLMNRMAKAMALIQWVRRVTRLCR
jgi:hypothetical protein